MSLEAQTLSRPGEITVWIRALAHVDPAVRESARQSLMGISADELSLLRQAVAAERPLRPAQIDAIHQIVTFVLARQQIRANLSVSGNAFLGVNLPPRGVDPFDNDIGIDGPPADSVSTGVPVIGRLCGFIAYRYLGDGDIIEAITRQGIAYRTRTCGELLAALADARPGESITLAVRRGARLINITFPLDARPEFDSVEPQQIDALVESALTRAADEWSANFEPLIEQAGS